MKQFTVTFQVDEGAAPPAIFEDCCNACWATGAERFVGGAIVTAVSIDGMKAPPTSPERTDDD